MVRHIVMFKLRGSDEERKKIANEFAQAINALPEKIQVLRSVTCAVNENPMEEWDVVLTADLDSMEDVAIYAAHPEHVAAASILAPYKEARACVDYSTEL